MDKESPNLNIPDKLYFPIREAARIAGVEPHVLRFWEKEFPTLRPRKGESGQRRYRRKDIEMALEIKRLLYRQCFTIAGARNELKKIKRGAEPVDQMETKRQRGLPLLEVPSSSLGQIRRELNEILSILGKT